LEFVVWKYTIWQPWSQVKKLFEAKIRDKLFGPKLRSAKNIFSDILSFDIFYIFDIFGPKLRSAKNIFSDILSFNIFGPNLRCAKISIPTFLSFRYFGLRHQIIAPTNQPLPSQI
jgi:hypothetical protein